MGFEFWDEQFAGFISFKYHIDIAIIFPILVPWTETDNTWFHNQEGTEAEFELVLVDSRTCGLESELPWFGHLWWLCKNGDGTFVPACSTRHVPQDSRINPLVLKYSNFYLY